VTRSIDVGGETHENQLVVNPSPKTITENVRAVSNGF